MSISILLQQIGIIFLMIGVGFAAQKLHIVSSDSSKILSELLMKIGLPFTLLASAKVEGGKDAVAKMLLAFALLMACYILSALVCEILARVFHLSGAKRAVFVLFSVLPNSAFIGIPLVSALLGSEGVLYGAAGIMAYNLFFFTYGTALFRKKEKFHYKVFLTPANFTTVVMIFMLLTGLRLPPMLDIFCTGMSGMTTPLAMLIIGVMLGSSNLLEVVKNKFLYGITLLRCFVFPLGFTLVLALLGLDATLCMGVIILCACACGSLGAVLAKQTDQEPELASQAVVHSTLMLVLSMPLVVLVAQSVL